MVTIRRAVEADQAIIKQMVKDEDLDPTSLNWPQFLIAEAAGEIVGIGQIRPYPKCRELGSIAVKKEHRGNGVGSAVIQALLAGETGDVYLECEAHNVTYYNRFGFVKIQWWQTPPPLRYKHLLISALGRVMGYRMAVMVRRKIVTSDEPNTEK